VHACGTFAHICRPRNEPLNIVVRQKSARSASLRVSFLPLDRQVAAVVFVYFLKECVIKLIEIFTKDASSEGVLVSFGNLPRKLSSRSLVEASFVSEAGIEKQWGKGYTYRVDKRADAYGGHQIHIGHKSNQWAYKYDGTKSERNKYTAPATNTVKDIVRDIFNLGPEVNIEARVESAASKLILIEVNFSE
jgi:hypothetical protein